MSEIVVSVLEETTWSISRVFQAMALTNLPPAANARYVRIPPTPLVCLCAYVMCPSVVFEADVSVWQLAC